MDPSVLALLSGVGLRADAAWAAANCKAGLGPDAAVQCLLSASLSCDLRQIVSGASLPNPLGGEPCIVPGPFLLQILRADDVSIPTESRLATGAHAGRTLKFVVTDGCADCFAVEWRHLATVPSPIPVGSKLLCKNVPARRGLLLLSPDNTLFLGGQLPVAAPSGAAGPSLHPPA